MGICFVKTKETSDSKSPVKKVTKVTPSRTKREISRKYNFGQTVLGVGQYGKVFLATNKNDPS